MSRETWIKRRVAVLYGGLSEEREVSLQTGMAMHGALKARGYDAVLIDAGRDLAQRLCAERVEAAVLGLHGRYGEDGCVQGLLEVLGIPYTGTGVFGSALAMNKHHAKLAFAAAGLPLAPHTAVVRGGIEAALRAGLPFGLPVVVKPNASGSSVGVRIVREASGLKPALEEALRVDRLALVEAFVDGDEVSVSVLDGKPLGVIQIRPAEEFYDYRAKYMVESTQYIYPAPLAPELYRQVMEIGRQAHAAVNGRGVTRTDVLVSASAPLAVLEINTLPGMTSHSLVPKTAAAEGIPFEELVERLLWGAGLDS